jgi:hypothetical protein
VKLCGHYRPKFEHLEGRFEEIEGGFDINALRMLTNKFNSEITTQT